MIRLHSTKKSESATSTPLSLAGIRNNISRKNIPTKNRKPSKCVQILIVSLCRTSRLFKQPKYVILSR